MNKLDLAVIYKMILLLFFGLIYIPLANAGDVKIFSNSNKDRVYNLNFKITTFKLTRPMLITKINTYHWNDQKGASPGKIGIKGVGLWQATGWPGMHNTPNANWTVHPNIRLEPGTYSITDSDPATWSQNSGSGGFGFVEVFGKPVEGASSTAAPTPVTPQASGKSEWSSTFKNIHIIQKGKTISGSYDYAGGKIIGTIEGRTFSGWWHEDDDTSDCGPNNGWSGPMVWHFSADGKSFKGNYGKCSKGQRSFSSVSSNSIWNGNLISGSIDF